jgi:hypothetical protein
LVNKSDVIEHDAWYYDIKITTWQIYFISNEPCLPHTSVSSEIHLQGWHNSTSKPSIHHHEIMKDEVLQQFGYYLMSNTYLFWLHAARRTTK